MSGFRRFRLWLIALLVVTLPLSIPANVGASTLIYSETAAPCSTLTDTYVVAMRLPPLPGTVATYPNSILLHFLDGSTVEAAAVGRPSPDGLQYWFDDSAQLYQTRGFEWASAVVDIPPGSDDYVFAVTALPCTPEAPETASVSGVVVQHGSRKPVADLMICLREINLCDTTDETGSFSLADVPYGSYTVVSDGPKFRTLETPITVGEGGVMLELVQRRGGQ